MAGLTVASTGGVRLVTTAVARPALTSQVRPALVLQEPQARALLDAALREDVGTGGCFAAGATGVQVWSRPWDGANGEPGNAVQLGSVDWTYDTPAKHWVTVHRAMVTAAGEQHGETTHSVLGRVLGLTGISLAGERLSLATPPRRDPFRTHWVYSPTETMG